MRRATRLTLGVAMLGCGGLIDPPVTITLSDRLQAHPLGSTAASHGSLAFVPAAASAPPRGVDHDSWTQTYDGSAGHDVYAWLLQHTRAVMTP